MCRGLGMCLTHKEFVVETEQMSVVERTVLSERTYVEKTQVPHPIGHSPPSIHRTLASDDGVGSLSRQVHRTSASDNQAEAPGSSGQCWQKPRVFGNDPGVCP